MPLEPKEVWVQTLTELKPVADNSWVNALGDWLFQRVNAKLQIAGIVGPVNFTFNKGVFAAQMMSATPVTTMAQAAQKMGMAWEAAVLASNMATSPGASLGAPSPATTWSAPVTVIDPGSVSAAKANFIAQVSNAQLVDDPNNSKVAVYLREAFMMITFSTTGINCVVPTPSPLAAPCLPAS